MPGMQALRDVCLFVTGGLTFVPLCLVVAWLLHLVLSPPVRPPEDDHKQDDDGVHQTPPELPARDIQPTPDSEWHVTACQVLSDLAAHRVPQRGQPHVSRAGWVLIRRTFASPATSEIVSTSNSHVARNDSDSARVQVVGPSWHRDAALAVLRGPMLYLFAHVSFEDANNQSPPLVARLIPVLALDMRLVLVGLQTVYGDAQEPGNALREGVLFKRKNAVQLRTLAQAQGIYTAPRTISGSASGTAVYAYATQLLACGASPNGSGARPGAPSKMSKAFLFCASAPALEDWHSGLYTASILPLDALSGLRLPHLPSDDPVEQHEQRDEASAALNALLERIYRSVAPTAAAEAGLIEKMMRKVALARLPSFLTDVEVREVNLGSSPPHISNLRTVSPTQRRLNEAAVFKGNSASTEAEDFDTACLEMDLVFQGKVSMTVSAKLVLSNGFSLSSLNLGTKKGNASLEVEQSKNSKEKSAKDKMGAYKVNVEMNVEFTRVEGTMRLLIKPPPSNRVWFAFVNPPDLEIKITPIVSSRQVGWQRALDLIDSKIREAFIDSIVLPQMSDIPFADTTGFLQRGGLFADAARPGAANLQVVQRMSRTATAQAAVHRTSAPRTNKRWSTASAAASTPNLPSTITTPGSSTTQGTQSALATPGEESSARSLGSLGSSSSTELGGSSTALGTSGNEICSRRKAKLAQAKQAWNEAAKNHGWRRSREDGLPERAERVPEEGFESESGSDARVSLDGNERPDRPERPRSTLSLQSLTSDPKDLSIQPVLTDQSRSAGSLEDLASTSTPSLNDKEDKPLTLKERWTKAKLMASAEGESSEASAREKAERAAASARQAMSNRWNAFQAKRAAQKAEKAWDSQLLAAAHERSNPSTPLGTLGTLGTQSTTRSVPPTPPRDSHDSDRASSSGPSGPSRPASDRFSPEIERMVEQPPALPTRTTQTPPALPTRPASFAPALSEQPPHPSGAPPPLPARPPPPPSLRPGQEGKPVPEVPAPDLPTRQTPPALPLRRLVSAAPVADEGGKPVQAPSPVAAPEAVRAPSPVAAPVPAPVRAPSPVAAPEAVRAPSPIAAPEPVRAPSPVPAPAAPEPVQAPSPVRAPSPVDAPETVHAPEPVRAPSPVPAPEPISAPSAAASSSAPSPKFEYDSTPPNYTEVSDLDSGKPGPHGTTDLPEQQVSQATAARSGLGYDQHEHGITLDDARTRGSPNSNPFGL